MTEKEKMLAEMPYDSLTDELKKERNAVRVLVKEYNNLDPDSPKFNELIRKILHSETERVFVEPPFHCDYGYNIYVGDSFYANFNLVILDVAEVRIGRNCLFGPNVSIYTAGHPISAELRKKVEYGVKVSIGDNCWIGGNVVVNPGVHIGDNVVIGSGSVVTHDIPSNVVACGNPCRVIREITEEDDKYYFKKRKIGDIK